ncbi:MAG: FtsX-like permease family protein [Candidatus Poseidoniales archaeon]
MSMAGPWTLEKRMLTACVSLLAATLTAAVQWSDFDWSLGRSFTLFGLSLIAGLVVWSSLQWLLSSRHRILSVMARNNLVRRKRNTALVVIGLLVGSAIVTSSLVIGDSLDATMEEQFIAPLGDTDYYIKGNDKTTGLWTEWNQSRASDISDELLGWPEVEGARPGMQMSASVQFEGLGEPMATWYAFDANYSNAGGFGPIGGDDGIRYMEITEGNVVINEEMSDSISATIGDLIEIHWVDIDLDEGLVRSTTNLTVQYIVSDINTGHRNSRQPLLFTSLSQAQEITEKEEIVSHIGIAVKGDGNDALREDIKETVNEHLIAEDAGFTIETDAESGLIAVARTTGIGQLRENEVYNLTTLVHESEFTLDSVELLQVPLYNIAQQWFNVSGLASSSISSIEQTDDWDWYATGSGLSLQEGDGQWWIWTPDDVDDESIRDILLTGNESAYIAHADGVRHIDLAEGAPDSDYLSSHSIDDLASFCFDNCTLLALEESDGNVWLHSSADGLETWTVTNLVDDGSALGVDLAVDEDEIIVRIGGILGSQTCSGNDATALNCTQDSTERRDLFEHGNSTWVVEGQSLFLLDDGSTTETWGHGLPNGTLAAYSQDVIWIEDEGLWAWDGSQFNALSIDLPPAANPEQAAIGLTSDRLIVTTGSGVAVLDGEDLSGRLPSRIKIDSVNRVPLTVVGCDGCDTMGFPSVESGRIQVSDWAGQTLSLESDDLIRLRGYLPAIRGQWDGELFRVEDATLSLPSPPGQPSFADMTFGLVSIPDAELLAGGSTGARSMVIIVGPGLINPAVYEAVLASIEAWADEQADLDSADLNVAPIKLRAIESSSDLGENFSMLFLIFGSFVIFAGILLVMNIFVMLADERKPEMGMARAIGMHRSDLRALFVQEGALLGMISSAVGALAGIAVAWILMEFMATAFKDTFSMRVVFDWTFQSLLAGFTAGFLVTWSTLWSTSMWISRLNVVAAIRSIPTRYGDGLPWWSILVTLLLVFSSLGAFGLAYLLGAPADGTRHAWWLLGGFTLMLAMVPPAFWILGRILPEDFTVRGIRFHRPVLLPRLILSILSLSMIFWGWKGDPISEPWEQGPFSFIILGIFMVAAGVLLLSSLAPLVTRFLSRLLAPLSGRIASVLPTSLAYPMATPFRTSMTMGMFSVVIFAVVILSGSSAITANNLEEMGDESGGDYEILAFSSSELDPDVGNWDLGELNVSDFDSIATIHTGVVKAERGDGEGDRLNVGIRGFDSNFTEHGALSLEVWATELGDTEEDAWAAVLADESLVIVDFSLTPQPVSGVETPPTLDLGIGDSILISDPSNSGVNRTVFVGGILKQEASVFIPGIYIQSNFAEERFDAKPQIVWFSLPNGTSVADQEHAADEIERGMIEEGVGVFVIEVAWDKINSFVLSIFGLLKAFLALGLVVGIAGLAVVTIRNVSERRHQIGILRALGFQRSMVVATFLVELSWVSFLGILNGALVGVGFHYALYDRFLKDDGADFIMPWNEIYLIVIGAYVLTLLATLWPVRKAASILPAEALRDPN